MQGSSDTSFIPKRNPVKNVRHTAARPVFVGTLLIRAFFFAVLIATFVLFFYDNRLNSQLDQEIKNLDAAIASFSETDMQQVLDTNTRLQQAGNRLQYAASIGSIFEALEVATIQTVQIDRLEIERLSDTKFDLIAKMKTGTFDSIIFQRGVLERDDKLVVSNITDLTLNSRDDSQFIRDSKIESINFRANLSVNTDSVPHRVTPQSPLRNLPASNINNVTETETETENEDGVSDGNGTGDNQVNQDDV